jgi:AAA domain
VRLTEIADALEAAAGLPERSAARPLSTDSALPAGVELAGRARLYDLSAYSAAAERAGTDFLIDEWVERGKIHMNVGPEKIAKTTKALRRIAAVTTETPYLGSRAQLGRAVLVTEMDPIGIAQLIEDDAIEIDWSRARVSFLDDYPQEERLAVIGDICREWLPDLLVLDPVDECFGLDGDAIFNPSRAGAPFDLMRSLARTGIAVDCLYHVNNAGRIANSYKFRSKPDHLFVMTGQDASDVTIKYRGRIRAIPRLRKITGNGIDGYNVETLVGGQKGAGRPAETAGKVLSVIRNAGEPLGPSAVAAAAEITEEAARAALKRLGAAEKVTRVDRGLYVAVPGKEVEL